MTAALIITRNLHVFLISCGTTCLIKKATTYPCVNNETLYRGECNYMLCVKWEDFLAEVDKNIEKAESIQSNQDQYDICKKAQDNVRKQLEASAL